MSEITEDTLKGIEAEYAKWGEFVNGGLGVLSFSFGLSCLGTPRPDITGILSLIFIVIFALYGNRHFPKKIKELRKKELSGIDALILLGFEKKYFGFVASVKKFPIYFMGWFFLGSVTFYGIVVNFG